MTVGVLGEPEEHVIISTLPVSPYFSVSREALISNLDRLRKHIRADIFYAVKANPEPEVLLTIAAHGAGFEVASLYELVALDGLAAPDRILYGTAVKPSAHIYEAYTRGVRDFVADSRPEIDKIARYAPGSNLFIRVRVDDSQSVFAFGEKFGAEAREVVDLVGHAVKCGLNPVGLSFHVGSQSTRLTAWADAIRTVIPLWKQLEAAGIALRVLNIGGGFPCQYDTAVTVPSIDDIGAQITSAVELLPGVRLIAEPGRFVVATAATLTTRVIARVDRDDACWLFLDAGCYNGLFEAMAYQGDTRYPVTLVHGTADGPLRRFNIAGPTGDSADVIARDVLLPETTREGASLVFHNVGAYTMSMSVPFNGFPKPTVHLT